MEASEKSGVVHISKQGPPSVLEYTNEFVGTPGNNQVLIRQHAIALNFVDVMFRNGSFPLKQFPATIGVEAAGVVEAVGPHAGEWALGDRVGYYFSLGAYAERRLIHKDELIRLPQDISFDQAAALMAKGLTARMLVKQAYPVQAGDVVLVHAAVGGVGSLVSRWAKSLGATVIGTVGNASKKVLAESQGTDLVIALDSENIAEQVHAFTHGTGVHAVFDGVGKATFSKSAPLVKSSGSIVLYGNASGSPKIDTDFLASRNISLVRPSLGQYLPDKQHVNVAVDELFEAVRTGILGDIKPAIYALSEVSRAHDDLEASRTTGSVVLRP
ncbi:quinone oxidoreductase family protein [Dyadobacter sandarakinus]|uniref:Quinone oxidoreductase n=1 Tax=Dyadobacter sandarakinus TaxID=2747268 RepID=A0ABX7I1R4_9BACT|nr:quinone oxidoreductase [Dyadobacter sandarakinus]QRQ99812.1 quinone oxidoreductase [Dyadobacter sandarakinus]